jgi:tRNA A-37 threonylcarbamoyl transferase component Bud32
VAIDYSKYDDAESEILIRYGQREPDRQDEVLAQYEQLAGSVVIRYLIFEFCPDLFAFACFLYLMNLSSILVETNTLIHAAVIWVQIALLWATAVALLVLNVYYMRTFKLKQMALPSDVGLSTAGIRLHRRNLHFGLAGTFVSWADITSVKIEQQATGKSGLITEPVLEIHYVGGHKPLAFKLSMVATIEERYLLYDFLKQFARSAVGDNDISGLVRMNNASDIPFTQLWSQALMDRRARIRTNILPKGTTLQCGRFFVQENIGGGGQGAVYRAEMLEGGEEPQTVILKEYVLPDREHIGDYKKAIEQFENEIRLMSKMGSVRIAKLIDAFVEDRRSYLVLEPIDGITLKQHVEKYGPIKGKQSVALAKQMLAILQQLHSMSPPVMHLDFSPENLMMNENGEIVLIDFNISSEQDSLRTKTVMGKQHYMAPEQYRGNPGIVSDIYSFGATMFYLLTGQEPEPISVSRPKEVNSDVHSSLDQFVARATALEECDRFSNISECLEALEQIDFAEPIVIKLAESVVGKELSQRE